jgi:N-acetylglucosaminyl-diphospho-decaprenol L-rhamnosyltransferase
LQVLGWNRSMRQVSPDPITVSASQSASVSILIVNYNSGIHLEEAVLAVAAQTYDDFDVVVVDNCSTDGSLALARSALGVDKRFLFVKAESNLGFAAGNNLAATMARGAWLALLNPDAAPARDWLEQLIEATRRHPHAVMFGSTQVDAADPERLDGAGDHYLAVGLPWRGGYGWPLTELPTEGEVFSPCAAACLIRADAFREAKGFDERFFCYVEDVDLAFRLRLIGHCCFQVPAAVVRHTGGGSAGPGKSTFARRHGTRNLIWCFVKCMPGPLFWPLLPFHILTLLFLVGRAAATGMIRPVWQGIMMSLRGLPSIWRSRCVVQRTSRVPWWQIARSLTWNPLVYLRRAPRTLSGCAQ